jgi:hypothetical protein
MGQVKMKQTDLDQINKNESISLLLAQTQQADGGTLQIKLDREINRPNLSVNAALPPANEQVGKVIDTLNRSEHLPPQARPNLEVNLTIPPEPILNIKPKWQTKNRLQNCHKPKQK